MPSRSSSKPSSSAYLWDTANVYGFGSSEEIVGRALKKYSRREDIVLATKVHFTMHDRPGGSGLSRKAIMEQIDASLAEFREPEPRRELRR